MNTRGSNRPEEKIINDLFKQLSTVSFSEVSNQELIPSQIYIYFFILYSAINFITFDLLTINSLSVAPSAINSYQN